MTERDMSGSVGWLEHVMETGTVPIDNPSPRAQHDLGPKGDMGAPGATSVRIQYLDPQGLCL
jgi:hypothetical protein